jgi:hypothetical protein
MKLVNEAKVGLSRRGRLHGEDFEVEHELLPGLEAEGAMEAEADFVHLLRVTDFCAEKDFREIFLGGSRIRRVFRRKSGPLSHRGVLLRVSDDPVGCGELYEPIGSRS